MLATYFSPDDFFGPLATGATDPLDGLHANQHLPIIVGAARGFEVTANATLADVTANFNCLLTSRYSYTSGGSNVNEHWLYPGRLGDAVAVAFNESTHAPHNSNGFHTQVRGPRESSHPSGSVSHLLRGLPQETCTTYNALKLARHLFSWAPTVATADAYERRLLNGILGTQQPGVVGCARPRARLPPVPARTRARRGEGGGAGSGGPVAMVAVARAAARAVATAAAAKVAAARVEATVAGQSGEGGGGGGGGGDRRGGPCGRSMSYMTPLGRGVNRNKWDWYGFGTRVSAHAAPPASLQPLPMPPQPSSSASQPLSTAASSLAVWSHALPTPHTPPRPCRLVHRLNTAPPSLVLTPRLPWLGAWAQPTAPSGAATERPSSRLPSSATPSTSAHAPPPPPHRHCTSRSTSRRPSLGAKRAPTGPPPPPSPSSSLPTCT